jgi:hypothetical protein
MKTFAKIENFIEKKVGVLKIVNKFAVYLNIYTKTRENKIAATNRNTRNYFNKPGCRAGTIAHVAQKRGF